jgi:uncharacterized protein YbaR (Trm112 family)
MKLKPEIFGPLVIGMRDAYYKGENAMEYARSQLGKGENLSEATLVAYDLQAGSYSEQTRRSYEDNTRWCQQIVDVLREDFTRGNSLLEVGVGEATTLATVVRLLGGVTGKVMGLDLSWSRCDAAMAWLKEERVSADIFVGDLFAIPLADESVDVVYTSHSLEPNGGREFEALRELLRVARRRLILCEPIYELGSVEAQARMLKHGYVRGLDDTLKQLGAKATTCSLLPYTPNPLNPSGIIVVDKIASNQGNCDPALRCPLTHTPLVRMDDVYHSPTAGIVYPILDGIPLLRAEHAVIASKFRRKRG